MDIDAVGPLGVPLPLPIKRKDVAFPVVLLELPPELGASRSARRRRHEQAWLTRKLQERFTRFAEILAEKERDEAGDYAPPCVKQKVPGLATEDFSLFFKERETLSG